MASWKKILNVLERGKKKEPGVGKTLKKKRKRIKTDEAEIRKKKLENLELKLKLFKTAKGWGKDHIPKTRRALLQEERKKTVEGEQTKEEYKRKKEMIEDFAADARKYGTKELEERVDKLEDLEKKAGELEELKKKSEKKAEA